MPTKLSSPTVSIYDLSIFDLCVRHSVNAPALYYIGQFNFIYIYIRIISVR